MIKKRDTFNEKRSWNEEMEWPFHAGKHKNVKGSLAWQDDFKTPRPHLDETKIEEMERLLSESMDTKILLEINIWKNGFFTSHVGAVMKIDPLNKRIQLQDELKTTIDLDIFSITNVMVK